MLHRSHLHITENIDEQCAVCKFYLCKTYRPTKNDGECTLHDNDPVRSDFTCDDFMKQDYEDKQ